MVVAVFYCPKSCNGKYIKDMAAVMENVKASGIEYRYMELFDQTDEEIGNFVEGCEVIAIGGGDGTVNRVINATYKQDIPYAFLPFGSGNDFSRTFVVDKHRDDLVTIIREGRDSVHDLWQLNGDRVFVQCILIGLSIKAIEIKNKTKSNGYVLPIVKALTKYKPNVTHVESKDGNDDGKFLIVTLQNVRTTANGLKMDPRSDTGDGLLEVICTQKKGAFRTIGNLISTQHGWLCNQPNTKVIRTDEVHIHSDDETVMYTMDGELKESKTLDVKLSPHKIRVRSL